jgi:hypothetical protein
LNATSEGAKNSNPRQFNQITITAVLSTKRNIELWQLLANGATRIVVKTAALANTASRWLSQFSIGHENGAGQRTRLLTAHSHHNNTKGQPKPV